jgi:hypothetical protein
VLHVTHDAVGSVPLPLHCDSSWYLPTGQLPSCKKRRGAGGRACGVGVRVE